MVEIGRPSLLLFAIVSIFSTAQAAGTGLTGIRTWSSVQEMNSFFEKHFKRENETTEAEWNLSLPTFVEAQEMSNLVGFLLFRTNFKNMNGEAIMSQYRHIARYIDITFLLGKYAVIHEKIKDTDVSISPFEKFWGYVVITAGDYAKVPFLHYSSPHFESDGDVCNESAVIFEKTGGRTLVVAGASRYAVKFDPVNPCQPEYTVADAAHNNETMFHAFNLAILNASKALAWSNGEVFEEFFLQWHGMSEKSCINSPALISVGASGNNSIYNDAELKANLLAANYGHSAHTPNKDLKCNLAATNNIFGRVINKVDRFTECHTHARAEDMTGHFIHIEQKHDQRHDQEGWLEAVHKTFYGI